VIAANVDLEPLAIVGPARSGKTTALLQRLEAARAGGYAAALVAGIEEPAPKRLHALALEVLKESGTPVRLIDDVEAEALFEEAAAPLLAMETELLELQIDPEVPGLRTPERFLVSAFRLARNLAEALIAPDVFLERSLAGATEFYAHPPNFAKPELIAGTKNEHRDSLSVSTDELQRQYRREIDLAKMLAQLFRAYLRLLRERGLATGRDAVAAAVALLNDDGARAVRMRERYRLAFIDDAQDLTAGELALLKGVFGERLDGVTLAGDPNGEMRGAGNHALDAIAKRLELTTAFSPPVAPRVTRPATPREEAAEIAAYVEGLLQDGADPSQVALLLRCADAATRYEEALLEREIPVRLLGDYNLFADRRALDALALLWNVHDPYRHDYLLRTLSNPAVNLSDASVAVLCGEPTERQTVLFDEEPARPPSGVQHRDPMRGVRLARNVLEGERDAALSDLARERVQRWRTLRASWVEAQRTLPFETFARSVWSEGLAREGAPGSARFRAQQSILQRLLERLCTFLSVHPEASLGDLLADAERRAPSSLETCPYLESDGEVAIVDVASARGRSFDHVVIPNARPGAFPRWYAGDAFHFSRRLGMVPRDNAGDAPTARTAKFTYYVHRVKAREHYIERERRIFAYARARARRTLLVTAFGRPTRGITAPEFLEELR
jgi:superfamily I DNA/RNA helicase